MEQEILTLKKHIACLENIEKHRWIEKEKKKFRYGKLRKNITQEDVDRKKTFEKECEEKWDLFISKINENCMEK